MMMLLRRFRAPLIGIVALIFSASITFAAAPSDAGSAGLANAATHAGKTVPVMSTDEQTDETVTETETETETDTSTETADQGSSDHCNVDLTLDPTVLATLNHGSVVCTAAQQDPPAGYAPDGYANHGAWVSSFAKGTHGSNHSSNALTHKSGN